MAIQMFLAMTGREIRHCAAMPPKIAWMACTFSPSDKGLTNLPASIADGSMIVLNDRLPAADHDPALIVRQIKALLAHSGTSSVVLDFQREYSPAAAVIVHSLVQELPCPVGVPPCYAKELDCPVFLPPVPPHIPADEYLQPWSNREIWLELALDAAEITITPQGSNVQPLLFSAPNGQNHHNNELHCHYCIRANSYEIRFHLYRTQDDLQALVNSITSPNVTRAVGLYSEFIL